MGILLALVISRLHPKPHIIDSNADLESVDESEFNAAYRALASLDIPVHFADLRATKVKRASIEEKTRDLLLLIEPNLDIKILNASTLSSCHLAKDNTILAFRGDESAVLRSASHDLCRAELLDGRSRAFNANDWDRVLIAQLASKPPSSSSIFEQRVVDFGGTVSGSVLELPISLHNVIHETISVSVGALPCGCISATVEKDQLLVGEKTRFILQLDTYGKSGWLEFDVPLTVVCSSGSKVETVRVSGFLSHSQYLSSTRVHFGVREEKDQVSRTVQCTDGTPFFSIESIKCPRGLHYEVLQNKNDPRYTEIAFVLHCSELGLGRHQVSAHVTFTDAAGESHTESICFSGDVVPPML